MKAIWRAPEQCEGRAYAIVTPQEVGLQGLSNFIRLLFSYLGSIKYAYTHIALYTLSIWEDMILSLYLHRLCCATEAAHGSFKPIWQWTDLLKAQFNENTILTKVKVPDNLGHSFKVQRLCHQMSSSATKEFSFIIMIFFICVLMSLMSPI